VTQTVHRTAYIAPGATVLGDVAVGAYGSVWYGAVVRGDLAPIVIGRKSNVQDGSIIHVKIGYPCRIGERTSIGHGAILHGCTIEDNVLVGIGAVVLDGARIGRGSIVGAGALVGENMDVPPGSLVLGVPGRVVGQAGEEQKARIQEAARHYVEAVRSRLVGTGQ
jgi:carbonic anhydrase/acetyltransferase-like protein (isoleucine patch superfamily)